MSKDQTRKNMTEPNIFVGNPLDERYLIDPDHTNINQAVEIAPQQEKDAHEALVEVLKAKEKITWVDELWSNLCGPTKRYVTYLDCLANTKQLASKSPEHRAAFCRIANNQYFDDELRNDVKRIIAGTEI